ncbi:glycosyltransferase family 2 protein [Nocardioides sp. ChNu-153]|uniref:glycosyltransferase family 2 protein n=1 Tax=unclassified Nocardioides TaxID=2615069 RepID=UPI0024072066|nr:MULTISPECIES: glycosyltransferase family 2 protein [unclassified Nocardioides]MDF9718001.1 glycosyltransferase family 2 protein [Nocardioides sp. ChNu-99]MDN7120936.1 glycosyltransferase family 2 protein [Nocardioides sp. ChNu-153]
MRTAVVVLNYGDPDDTLECVASLERSEDLDFDLYVVDNGPDDAKHAALRDAIGERGTVLATGENLGYAGGNNVGVRKALETDAQYVWILNPDTRVGPRTLGTLIEHLQAYPDCGVVGSRILYGGKEPRIWFDGATIDRTTGATSHVNNGKAPAAVGGRKVVDVDYVTGAAPLIRRATLDHVGLMPEHYFLYFEETDWCVRLQDAGWRTMVNRTASMVHLKRSSGSLPQPYYIYYMTRNRYGFARDALGIDPDASVAHLQETFLKAWRKKVEDGAPAWLERFDELVTMAVEDARAGRFGRNDLVTHFPRAEESLAGR